MEFGNDRHVFPISDLSESYVNGNLSLHIRLGSDGGTKIAGCDFPWILLTSADEVCGKPDSQALSNDQKLPVLIDDVQIVYEPQGMINGIGSAIRLQFLNPHKRRSACDPLYFSTVSANFHFLPTASWRLFENWEFDVFGEVPSRFGRRKLPSKMVECRPHVMDYFPCEDSKPGFAISDVLRDFIERFSILVGPNWLLTLERNVGKVADFPIQIADILIGPI